MKAIISTTTRQPIIAVKGSGLNSMKLPVSQVATIVNTNARKK